MLSLPYAAASVIGGARDVSARLCGPTTFEERGMYSRENTEKCGAAVAPVLNQKLE